MRLTLRRPRIVAIVVASIAAMCTSGCTSAPPPAAPSTQVQLTTALWSQMGHALAAAYPRHLPHVVVDETRSNGLEQVADAIEDGRADVAIEDAETAYIAYGKGTNDNPRPHRHIRAISVLFPTAVQIVVRGGAGIAKMADLRGRHVDVGAQQTPVGRASRLILQSHGLTYASISPVFGTRGRIDALQTGELDARFFYTPYPQGTIRDAMQTADAHLISIEPDSLAAIQEEHHFLKSVIIPAGTYPNQSHPILTVGMDVLLLCREDLPETLVYGLTSALFDSVADLRATQEPAAAIDPDRGPTATVPLHAGALRYYREREILK